MNLIRTAITLLLLLVLPAIGGRDARAQVVRGFVSAPAAGTPRSGRAGDAVDSAGHEYARGITASSGSFTLAVRRAA